jgi:uncharacterized membrane protein YkvA (DUF1232 family)
MSALATLIVIFSISYAVFPYDLIPDRIPVLGWVDDALVLYIMLLVLVKETHRYNRAKAMKRKPEYSKA